MADLLGLEQFDLIEQSLYQFVHIGDIQHLEKAHRALLEKGQVVTRYYRLMKRDGGLLWVQSYATLVNNPRNMPRPQHIVSICVVLGDDLYDQSGFLYDRCETNKNLDEFLQPAESSSAPQVDSQTAATKLAAVGEVKQTKANPNRGKLCRIQKKIKQRTSGCSRGVIARGRTLVVPSQTEPTTAMAETRIGDKEQQSISQSSVTFGNYSPCHLMQTSLNDITSAESRLVFEPVTKDSCSGISQQFGSASNLGFIGIGSTRRASDDSCSIVSSVASTSVSSRSSSHQLTPESSYPAGCYPISDSYYHDHQQKRTAMFSVAANPNNQSPENVLDHCNTKPNLVGQHISNEHSDNLIWPGSEEYSRTSMELMADNTCQHYHQVENHGQLNDGMSQSSHLQVTPTSQAWISQVQMLPSAPVYLDNHQLLYHSHHQQSVGNIYNETHQPYENNNYVDHPSTETQFHRIPSGRNLYPV